MNTNYSICVCKKQELSQFMCKCDTSGLNFLQMDIYLQVMAIKY
jgi:hypothetical protein